MTQGTFDTNRTKREDKQSIDIIGSKMCNYKAQHLRLAAAGQRILWHQWQILIIIIIIIIIAHNGYK